MNNWLKRGLIVAGILLAVTLLALALITRAQAIDVVTLPAAERPALETFPATYGLAGEDVSVTTEDGLALHGWYIPGSNGATVMVQHGSPGGRQDGLVEAAFLYQAGYNVLLLPAPLR